MHTQAWYQGSNVNFPTREVYGKVDMLQKLSCLLSKSVVKLYFQLGSPERLHKLPELCLSTHICMQQH